MTPGGSSRRARLAIGGGAVALVAVAALVTTLVWGGDPADASSPATATASAQHVSTLTGAALTPGAADANAAALVAAVGHGSVGDLGPMRLADGLVPPTNRWFSGLVFGADPQPVFPLPLSFGLTDDGFALGLPAVVTSRAGIIGPYSAAITVATGATTSRVVAYDSASVTLELLDGDARPTGRVLIAEGSPYVSYTATVAQTVRTGVAFTADDASSDAAGVAHVGGHDYAVHAPAGALDADRITLAAGEVATWYPLPDDVTPAGRAALARSAADPVVGTDLTADVSDDAATTTITYRTAGGAPSVVVTMPHQRAVPADGADAAPCELGTYAGVYGALELCDAPEVRVAVAVVQASGALDLTGISKATKAGLVEQLTLDVAATPAFPSDTYFGGKALYRAATLVALGHQLGADDVVASLRATTVAALREWTEPGGCTTRVTRCFQYDESAHGLVGLNTSFGSELFNDHHFHYGYFLAAGGLLAADDPALAADLAPVLDLLAIDIAGVGTDGTFPDLRVFDAYQGHSWASGTAPFADANNQESTSEATSAWNGLALWAKASAQPELETRATWLLSAEVASASAYWTAPPLDESVYSGFEHQVFALSWGGKRDYATWFSAEPSAMLGIQLIPMPPVATYLAGDPDRIRANVAEATPGGFDVQFGDYLLMYLALADPEAASAQAETLPDSSIDDADSRTYLLAWLASR